MLILVNFVNCFLYSLLASWPHFCSGLTFVLFAPLGPPHFISHSVTSFVQLLLYCLLTERFYYCCRIACAARAHWP